MYKSSMNENVAVKLSIDLCELCKWNLLYEISKWNL